MCLSSLGTLKSGIWSSTPPNKGATPKVIKKGTRRLASIPASMVESYLESLGIELEEPMRRLGAMADTTFPELDSSGKASSSTRGSQGGSSQNQSIPLLRLPVPPGFSNLGATCYLNSILQCLFMNVPFRHGLYRFIRPSSSRSSKLYDVLEALQAIFARMELGYKATLSLKVLATALGLDTGEQQDPQEFATLFLTKVEESFKGLPPNPGYTDLGSLLPSIYRGKLDQVIECGRCGRKSISPCSDDLRLPLSTTSSVRDLVEEFFQPEFLSGDNAYDCDTCGRTDATKAIEASAPPPVLNLHLMRYVYDMSNFTKKKLKTPIRLSSTVEIPVAKGPSITYRLVGVLNHIGASAYSGHYVSEAMDWGTGIWWRFNDEEVEQLEGGPRHMIRHGDEAGRNGDVGSEGGNRGDHSEGAGVFKEAKPIKKAKSKAGRTAQTRKDKSSNSDKKRMNSKADKSSKAPTATRKASPSGSEDAYMLIYVRAGYLEKYASLTHSDRGATPTESVADAVRTENDKIIGEYKTFKETVARRSERIDMRKQAVSTVLRFDDEQRDPKAFDCGAHKHFNFVHGPWLREWATAEAVHGRSLEVDDSFETVSMHLMGASKMKHLPLLCPHRAAVAPETLREFKIVSKEVYDDLIKAVADEMGIAIDEVVDFHIDQSNYSCSKCEASFKSNVKAYLDKVRAWKQLVEVVEDPQAQLNEDDDDAAFLVATSFITCIKKSFEEKCKLLMKEGPRALKEPDTFDFDFDCLQALKAESNANHLLTSTSEVVEIDMSKGNSEDPASDNVSAAKIDTPTEPTAPEPTPKKKDGGRRYLLDPTVNGRLVCEHNKLKRKRKGDYKMVSANVWRCIKDKFANAVELPADSDKCQICIQNKQELANEKHDIKDWASDGLKMMTLKKLAMDKRKDLGYPKETFENFLLGKTEINVGGKRKLLEEEDKISRSIKLFAVDREKVNLWRVIFENAKNYGTLVSSEAVNGTEKVEKCACEKHCKALLPERVQEVVKGVGLHDDKGIGQDSTVELLTEDELNDLNSHLHQYDSLRGIENESSIVPCNTIETFKRAGEEYVCIFESELCEECGSIAAEMRVRDLSKFKNKAVMVTHLATNAHIPGTAESLDSNVEGGVLAATTGARTTRNRGKKGHEIFVDSRDTLGNFRLKLFENLNLSPVNQHVFYNGVELATDQNMSSLASLGILAGSTIYVQNDKRNMTKAGKAEHDRQEETILEVLYSCIGTEESWGDNHNSYEKSDSSSSRRRERGFGGSWLTAGVSQGSSEPEKESEVIELLDSGTEEEPEAGSESEATTQNKKEKEKEMEMEKEKDVYEEMKGGKQEHFDGNESGKEDPDELAEIEGVENFDTNQAAAAQGAGPSFVSKIDTLRTTVEKNKMSKKRRRTELDFGASRNGSGSPNVDLPTNVDSGIRGD